MDQYNLEAVYDEQIAPLMKKVLDICKANDLPVVASFCYAIQADGGVDLCSSAILPVNRTPETLERMLYALKNRPGGMLAVTIVNKAGG